ncbi:MAG: hypothetical protein ACP5N0_14020 [Methanosarcina sp.]|jgi:hypothetical protein|uniref:hypothetical protein n=1 Tax=Methanosarcina sp. TaxID=2213 RepID=UPI003BB68AEE
MTGNMCPLLQSKCNEQCKWYIEEAEDCAVVALANNLSMVTYSQVFGGSLRVVRG